MTDIHLNNKSFKIFLRKITETIEKLIYKMKTIYKKFIIILIITIIVIFISL